MVSEKRELQRNLYRKLILSVIKDSGPIARVDISRLTRIRPLTVSNFVNTLIRENLISEIGHGQSRGGRKPTLCELNSKAKIAIGVQVASKSIWAVGVDLRGNIIKEIKREVILKSKDTLSREIIETITKVINKIGVESNKILGVGLGIPGLINRQEGTAILYDYYPWWKNIPFKALIETKIGVPVYVENDTKALALAENWFGLGRKVKNMLYVEISDDGISTGIIINGKIFYGVDGVAGELGHTVIDKDGQLCACGRRGCLETAVSFQTLFRKARQHVKDRVLAQELGRNRSFEGVIKLAQTGNRTILKILKEVGECLGIGIVNAINFLNPKLIVIGGTWGRLGESIFEKPIKNAIKEQALNKETKVLFTKLGDNSGALGATTLVISNLFYTE